MDMVMKNLLKISDPNTHKNFVKTLPPKTKSRVQALLALEEEAKGHRADLDKEMGELRDRYEALFQPFYDAREKIVAGETELKKEDLEKGHAYMLKKAEEDYEEDEEVKVVDVPLTINAEEAKHGIPGFWKHALCNHSDLKMSIEEHDMPVLDFLTDIASKEDDSGFKLTFKFSDNQYFTNKTLTKTYNLVKEEDEIDVEDIIGDDIKWNSGENVTQRIEKKKQKQGKSTRVVSKVVKQDSFFHFFDSSEGQVSGPEELVDWQEMELERGLAVKDQLIPRAVEWFCGEHNDDMMSDDEEEEEEEDEEDEESDEPVRKPKKGKKDGSAAAAAAAAPQQECKQQ